MARFLFRGTWFDELAPGSMYEVDFERIILSNAHILFPDYFAFPFKPIVSSDEDSARPDLALVSKTYVDWWVVEVEMGQHSLQSHVLPQVRTLSQAYYGDDLIPEMTRECPSLVPGMLLELIKGKQAGVFVIINSQQQQWLSTLEAHGATVAFVEVFRSDRNEQILVVEGALPAATSGLISGCSFDRVLPRFIVVDSPSVLGAAHGEKVVIYYDNCATEWQRLDASDRVWLAPIGMNPLSRRGRYGIVRRTDGSLAFTRNS